MHGLGPVHVGMSADQAAQALGTPLRAPALDDSPGCWMTRRADGQDPDIGYMIVYGQVRRIDLLPPAVSPTAVSPANVRTRAGIGIGSTEQLLWQTYGASLKVAPHAYTGADGGRTFTLAPSGGRSGILFETFNGQVTLIRTGLRPELGYVEGCS